MTDGNLEVDITSDNLGVKSINSKIGIIESSGLYTRINPVKNVYNSYIFNEVYFQLDNSTGNLPHDHFLKSNLSYLDERINNIWTTSKIYCLYR